MKKGTNKGDQKKDTKIKVKTKRQERIKNKNKAEWNRLQKMCGFVLGVFKGNKACRKRACSDKNN